MPFMIRIAAVLCLCASASWAGYGVTNWPSAVWVQGWTGGYCATGATFKFVTNNGFQGTATYKHTSDNQQTLSYTDGTLYDIWRLKSGSATWAWQIMKTNNPFGMVGGYTEYAGARSATVSYFTPSWPDPETVPYNWDPHQDEWGQIKIKLPDGTYIYASPPTTADPWPDANYTWVPDPIGSSPGYFVMGPKGSSPTGILPVTGTAPTTAPTANVPTATNAPNVNSDMSNVELYLQQVRDMVKAAAQSSADHVGDRIDELNRNMANGLNAIKSALDDGSTGGEGGTVEVDLSPLTADGEPYESPGALTNDTTNVVMDAAAYTQGTNTVAVAERIASTLPDTWAGLTTFGTYSLPSIGQWWITITLPDRSYGLHVNAEEYASVLGLIRTMIKWGSWCLVILLIIRILKNAN